MTTTTTTGVRALTDCCVVVVQEAYGFAGMILTTVAFIAWLFAIFASEETLEAYGAPSGATTQHYARVLPMWVFAALLYAFLGYECLNLMSTPDDMDVRFAGVVPDPSEYIVSDAEVAAGMKNMVGKQTDIPLFRDILAREATAKIFNERIREEIIAQCAASVSG